MKDTPAYKQDAGKEYTYALVPAEIQPYARPNDFEADVFDFRFSEDTPAGQAFRTVVYQRLAASPKMLLIPGSGVVGIFQTWKAKDGVQ